MKILNSITLKAIRINFRAFEEKFYRFMICAHQKMYTIRTEE